MPKLDKQDQRIADIFGVKEVPDVTPETLARYLAYLKQHLTFPCQRTGIEDLGCFSWEEYYTFGPGSKKEYEQLKKKRASYTDTYELLGFDDEVAYLELADNVLGPLPSHLCRLPQPGRRPPTDLSYRFWIKVNNFQGLFGSLPHHVATIESSYIEIFP